MIKQRVFGVIVPQVRIHTTIDLEDYEFLTKKNIKPAHIIRERCKELKAIESGQLQESISSLKEQKQRVTERLQKTLQVIGEELSEEQFNKILEKI